MYCGVEEYHYRHDVLGVGWQKVFDSLIITSFLSWLLSTMALDVVSSLRGTFFLKKESKWNAEFLLIDKFSLIIFVTTLSVVMNVLLLGDCKWRPRQSALISRKISMKLVTKGINVDKTVYWLSFSLFLFPQCYDLIINFYK